MGSYRFLRSVLVWTGSLGRESRGGLWKTGFPPGAVFPPTEVSSGDTDVGYAPGPTLWPLLRSHKGAITVWRIRCQYCRSPVQGGLGSLGSQLAHALAGCKPVSKRLSSHTASSAKQNLSPASSSLGLSGHSAQGASQIPPSPAAALVEGRASSCPAHRAGPGCSQIHSFSSSSI